MSGKTNKRTKKPTNNDDMLRTGSGVDAVINSLNGNDVKKGKDRQKRSARDKRFIWIAPDSIVQSSPMQQRKPFDPDNSEEDREFLDNIKEHGVITPIAVRLLEQWAGQKRQYACIAGHRRWAAANVCEIKEIAAVLYEGITDNRIFHTHTIIENVHRKDLSDMELAQSLHDYKKQFNVSLADVEIATGVSKSKISMLLKILAGPQEVMDLLNSNAIRWRIAYDIVRLSKTKRGKVIKAIRSGVGASSAMDLLQVDGPKSATVKIGKNTKPNDFLGTFMEQLPKSARKAIDSAGLFDKPARDKLVFLALAVTEGTDDINWDDALVRYKSIRIPVRKRIAKSLDSINRAYSEASLVSDDQANQVLEATVNFVAVLGKEN